MNLPLVALTLAILTAAMALVVPAYFGRKKPGYSHLRDTISELGEAGSPVGFSVSYYGFIPIALLLWLFLAVAVNLVPRDAENALWLFSLVGAGYFGGAIFRCDAGGPLIGTWANTFHILFGSLEYLGAVGAFSSMRFSSYWTPLSNVMEYAVPIVLVSFIGFSFPHNFRGLFQRIAETTIFTSVVVMGIWVYAADG